MLHKTKTYLLAGSLLTAAIATSGIAAGAGPANATPVSCSAKKINNTTGSATCAGGNGTVRVVLRCVDNFSGDSSTQYGAYVAVGKTSTRQCYPAQRSAIYGKPEYQTKG